MLTNLVIHDFAIIEHLEINFESGMTVLTGETGAGKSIIIDALGLLVGGRGSIDFIRHGAKKTNLQGQFIITDNLKLANLFKVYDIEPDGSNVLLEREIALNGHNVCRVNSKIVTTAVLRTIGEQLVDIHGQNEHQALMNPDQHLTILDQYGGTAISAVRLEYTQVFERYRALSKQLNEKQQNEQAYAQRLDMLQYQIDEIETAQIQPEEDQLLANEHDQLANFQRIKIALQASLASLVNDEINAVDLAATAMEQMTDIASLSQDYLDLSDHLTGAYYDLQDVSTGIQNQLDSLEFDDDRLNEIEQRLEVINDLKRKYGPNLADVLAYEQKIIAEAQQMKQVTDAGGEIEQQFQQEKQALIKKADELTDKRKKVAIKLTKEIHQQLSSLYMDKAIFKVDFHQQKPVHYRSTGQDQVAFYLRTNPGEGLKPLVKIASGGELSRIMLAIKTIIAHSEGVTSIIFDEVDTGVSGRVAQAIADKISLIARYSQVLCITHLAQVAAMSDHQYLIEKKITHNVTTTSLREVDGNQRIEALAKMIAGKVVTVLAREHAAELLQQANEIKQKDS